MRHTATLVRFLANPAGSAVRIRTFLSCNDEEDALACASENGHADSMILAEQWLSIHHHDLVANPACCIEQSAMCKATRRYLLTDSQQHKGGRGVASYLSRPSAAAAPPSLIRFTNTPPDTVCKYVHQDGQRMKLWPGNKQDCNSRKYERKQAVRNMLCTYI